MANSGSDVSFSGTNIAAPAMLDQSTPEGSMETSGGTHDEGPVPIPAEDTGSWCVPSDRGANSDRGRSSASTRALLDRASVFHQPRRTIKSRSKSQRSTPSPSTAQADDIKTQLKEARDALRRSTDNTRRAESRGHILKEECNRIDMAYAEFRYQSMEEFSQYQEMTHHHLDLQNQRYDSLFEAAINDRDGTITEIQHLESQRATMRDAARHIYVRGGEMTKNYEDMAVHCLDSEQNASRIAQNLHSELQEALNFSSS